MTDIEPVEISTPAYSSPEGEGEGLKMVPIIDDDAKDDEAVVSGLSAEGRSIGGGEGEASNDADKKASEWVAEIEATEDQDALDSVLERYSATGKDFSTVAAAAEARQDALDSDDS